MSLNPSSGAGKRPSLKASSGPGSTAAGRPLGAVREHRASTFDDDEKEEPSSTGKKPWSSQDVFDWLHDQWVKSRHYSIKALPSYPSHVSLQEYFSGNGVCQHSHRDPHCVVYAVKGLARGLVVGYGLNSAFYLATSLFSRRMFRRPLVTLGQVFLADSSFKFARFLGAMGFVYRTLQCLFCKLRGRPGKSNSALAAFIAGITILLDNPDRRSTIAGYLVVRGLYELARTLAYHGHVHTYPHLTKWIFAVCQIPIMYSFLREPHALNKSYHRFILNMGRITPAILHHIYGITQYDFHACQPVYHEGTCINYNLTDFIHGATVRAPRIYIPVHVLPSLIFKRKHVMKNPLAFLVESFVAIARSCLFLASYTTIVKSGVCFWRQFLGRNESWAAGLTGLTTGLSLLFEHPARHAELMLYCVPRAIETTFNLYEAVLPGWFTRLRTNGVGDVFTFCVAAALFVYCADTKPKLKNLNATIFRLIFGSGTTMTPSSPELRALASSAAHVPALTSSQSVRSPRAQLIGGSDQSGKAEAGSDADDDASLEAEEAKVREARVARISAAVPALPAQASDAKKLTSPTNTGGTKSASPRERLPPLVVNSSASIEPSAAKPAPAQSALSPNSLSPSAAGEPQHARRRSGVAQDINLYSPLTPVPLLPSLIAARSSGHAATNSPPISPRVMAARRHSNVEGAADAEAHTPTSGGLARRGSGTVSSLSGDGFKYDVFFVGWPRVLRQPVQKPLDSLASSTTSLSSSSSSTSSVPAAPSIFELELFLFLSALGFDCYYDATDPSAPLKTSASSPHPATNSLSQSVPSLALPVAALPPQPPAKPSSPRAPAAPLSPSGAAYHTAGLPLFDTIEATLERELSAASTSRLLLCVLSDSTFAQRPPSAAPEPRVSGFESPALSESEADQQYDHAEGLKRVIRARGADCLFPVIFRASRSKMQQQALSFSRERRQSLTGGQPSTPTPVLTGPLSAPITNLSASVPTISMHSPRSNSLSSPRAPASPSARRSSADFRSASDIGEFFALSANGIELSASPHHIRKNNSGAAPSQTNGAAAEESGTEVFVASPDDISIEEGFHGVVTTVQRLAEYAGLDSAALQRRNILLPKHNEFFRNVYLQVRATRHSIMRTVNAESAPSSPNLLMAPGHIPELIKRLRGGVVHALTQYMSAHGSMPASPALGMSRKMSASATAATPSSHSTSSSTGLTQSLSPRIAVTPVGARPADLSSPARPAMRPASHISSISSPRTNVTAVSPRTPKESKPTASLAVATPAAAAAPAPSPAPATVTTTSTVAPQSNGVAQPTEDKTEATRASEDKPAEEEEDEEPAEIPAANQKAGANTGKPKGPVSQGSSSSLNNKKKNNRRRRR